MTYCGKKSVSMTSFHGSFSALALVLLVGCGAGKPPAFTPQGYQQPDHKYRISYVDANAQRVMSSNWRVDNYFRDLDNELVPKEDDIYETEFEFDLDDDGKPDKTEELAVYDLRFVHLRTAGVVWIRSIPVSQYDGNKALDVFLQNYLDSVAGAGFEVARFGKITQLTEKRYAPHLVSSAPATVAGKEALVSVVEIANVDELQISPAARRKRIKIVLIRPGFSYPVTFYLGMGASTVNFPVILVAVYANQPDYFEQNLPDFDSFLGRVEIGGVSGFKEKPAATTNAPATSDTTVVPADPGSTVTAPVAPKPDGEVTTWDK